MSIKIDLRIFLFGILFFFTKQIEIYAVLMLFAFLHELGHLCAGLALGFKVNSIGVNPFGFQISFKTRIEDYNQRIKEGNELSIKKIVIALSGPLMNLLIVLICYFVKTEYIFLREQIIYANLLLAIFNLLPIYPLDGGRILKELTRIGLGMRVSYKITNLVANFTIILLTVISSIAILYVHNIAIVVILAYLWYLVIIENKRYKIKCLYELKKIEIRECATLKM